MATWHVIWTKNKLKKQKVWNEGVLKVQTNRNAVLYASFESRTPVESIFLKPNDVVTAGFEIEMDNALVEVEGPYQNEVKKDVVTAKPVSMVKKYVFPSTNSKVSNEDVSGTGSSTSGNNKLMIPIRKPFNPPKVVIPVEVTKEINKVESLVSEKMISKVSVKKDTDSLTESRSLSDVAKLLDKVSPPISSEMKSLKKLPTIDMLRNTETYVPTKSSAKINSGLSFGVLCSNTGDEDADFSLPINSTCITGNFPNQTSHVVETKLSNIASKENNTAAVNSRASKPTVQSKDVISTFKAPRKFSSQAPQNLPAMGLYFPTATIDFNFYNFKSAVSIPNSFDSIEMYRNIYLQALTDELNKSLYDIAKRYSDIFIQLNEAKNISKAAHGNASVKPLGCEIHSGETISCVSRKPGPNQNRTFLKCNHPGCKYFSWSTDGAKNESISNALSSDSKKQQYFRSKNVNYYAKVKLILSYEKSEYLKNGKRGFESDEFVPKNSRDSRGNVENKGEVKYFLKFENSDLEPTGNYSKQDLWVLSTNITFDSHSKNNVLFAISNYYGNSGLLHISFVDLKSADLVSNLSGLEARDYIAIRCENAMSELNMMSCLHALKIEMPLTPVLLGRKVIKNKPNKNTEIVLMDEIDISEEILTFHLSKIRDEFTLNADQYDLLYYCSQWFRRNDQSSPIVLAHGVFGAGKSMLICAICVFICRILEEVGETSIRVLIASNTNVAVDRILLGLQKVGFLDFARVGSAKKIAKPLLKHVLTTGDSGNDQILREYKEMLSESMPEEDRKYLLEAISELNTQQIEKRVERLKNMKIVGVTCAASNFEILCNHKFEICILDESSQIVEPSSLLPLVRFGSERCILIGDPKQLPPTIRCSSENYNDIVGSANDTTLSKTMFVRLHETKCPLILLRTQYRLNPQISKISNELFYNSTLLDGVTENDRGPYISNLSPLSFLNVEGNEVKQFDGSFCNFAEVDAISKLVSILLKFGVAGNDIGLISLYKSQAFKLQKVFSDMNLCSKDGITTSTVDAFQGAEREIIIVSTVRTKYVGFINSPLRLNVTLTRARRHLIIVGSKKLLEKDPLWSQVLGFIKQRFSIDALLNVISNSVVTNPNESNTQSYDLEEENNDPIPDYYNTNEQIDSELESKSGDGQEELFEDDVYTKQIDDYENVLDDKVDIDDCDIETPETTFIASRSVDLFQKNEFSPSRQRSPKVRVPTTFCDDDEDFDDITMHVPKFQF